MRRILSGCGRVAVAMLALAVGAAGAQGGDAKKTPNVVVILADDIGYGDLGCYGATKVKTPNVDRLARGGIRFTDGYAASATCTPTRYSMLTGQYAWRKKGTNILPGNASLIIEPGQGTLASMFRRAGYATGAVGKWHLGLGGAAGPDWNTEIKPGPRDIGFDYSFLIPATGDRTPCVYVENHRVHKLDPKDPIAVSYGTPIGDEPTGKKNPELLKMKLSNGHDNTIVNGISRIGFMTGGKAARWVDEDMADVVTGKAVDFIGANKSRPFFLYFATHDIHVPRAPHPRFVGKSECGVRGDALVQFDWAIGEVTKALEKHGLLENTIIVVTSDNGPVLDDGYADGAVRDLNGHRPAGRLRGGKYSLFEAGCRVPFLVHWPARAKAGESAALVSQVDLYATFAQLLGEKLGPNDAPDSLAILAALVGESRVGRPYIVHHAGGLAIRRGPWKFIPANQAKIAPKKKATEPLLFNLDDDLEEMRNVAAANPEIVRELSDLLQRVQSDGRTRKAE